MVHHKILEAAAELVAAHGDRAKFLVAERIDRALVEDDGEAHDRWCLIGKAVALMSMARPQKDAAKPATQQPAKPKARDVKAA